MDIVVTFIGNATTLITYGELTILTDPNFLHQGQRAYLGYGLVSKRLRAPAMTVDELPPVDAIVLSHMHGDHWDRIAQSRLDHDLLLLTTPDARKKLVRRAFGNAHGLRTWESHTMTKGASRLVVTALPGRHAPGWTHRLLPPVMGSMLEFGSLDGAVGRRLYISGDTLLVEELAEITVRFQAIDVGILHLGGTRLPAGGKSPFGLTVTMDGRQGADLVDLLDLPRVIAVHYDDYGVFASPLAAFTSEMLRRGRAGRLVELERGASVSL